MLVWGLGWGRPSELLLAWEALRREDEGEGGGSSGDSKWRLCSRSPEDFFLASCCAPRSYSDMEDPETSEELVLPPLECAVDKSTTKGGKPKQVPAHLQPCVKCGFGMLAQQHRDERDFDPKAPASWWELHEVGPMQRAFVEVTGTRRNLMDKIEAAASHFIHHWSVSALSSGDPCWRARL